MENDDHFCLDNKQGKTISLLKALEGEEQEDEQEYIDENSFGGISSFDHADLTKTKTTALGAYDPNRKNMTVVPGLNLKGKCDNPDCMSNKNKTFVTWIPKGFGEFEMNESRFDNVCQGCGQEVDSESIITFGFTRASIVVNGRKFNGQKFEKIKPIEFSEREGKFIKFEDADEKIVKWASLKISVKQV